MNNFLLKRILPTILSAATVVGAAGYVIGAASSDPVVVYNGAKKEIEFRNALPFLGNREPDLFPEMKDLMPGDSVTQEITVGAENIGFDRVRIYLRAENPNEDYQTLLEEYGHWVDFQVRRENTIITGNLERGVLLGIFENGMEQTLNIKLSIDIEAGNALKNLIAEVDWVFTAEVMEAPVIPIIPKPPVLPQPDTEESDLLLLTSDHINYIIGYDDGLVHPEASITRAEVATIFYRLLSDAAREEMWCTESRYPDVTEEDWYYIAISTLTNGGMLVGYPDGTFRPDEPITRAELATIISRFDTKFGSMEHTEAFPDTEGHWAEEYIDFSAVRRYVIGYPDGTFRPDQDITRAETVTMVNRCLQRSVDEEGLTEEYINWPDNTADAWYYYEILEAANYHDYLRSDRPAEEQAFCHEDWTELIDPIDWAYVEKEWILIYTGE